MSRKRRLCLRLTSQMPHAPTPQRLKHRTKREAMCRWLALSNPQHRLAAHGPGHQPITLQFPQLLAPNLSRHPRHAPPQVAKSNRPIAKPPKDHRLPTTLNHSDCRVNRTPLPFDIARSLVRHLEACFLIKTRSLRTGYFKVPDCQSTETNLRLLSLETKWHPRDSSASSFPCRVSKTRPLITLPSGTTRKANLPGRHYFGCGSAITGVL